MELVNKDIMELKPYPNNPRKSHATTDKVKKSIKEFGFKQPIVLDKDNVIIVGHSRFYAAKELDLKQVPCVIAIDLNPTQIRAYRIADNRISQDAEWDTDLLTIELKELNISDFDFSQTGFTKSELESLTIDPLEETKNLTSITEESSKVQPAEFHEANIGENQDEEWVNLHFTMKFIDRKMVFDKLTNIKDKFKLTTASDALIKMCKE